MTTLTISINALETIKDIDDSIFITGDFNNWNNKEYLLNFDSNKNFYTTTITIGNNLKELVLKFYNATKDSWFNLPSNILSIDDRNDDSNNIVYLSDLPFDNGYVIIINSSDKKDLNDFAKIENLKQKKYSDPGIQNNNDATDFVDVTINDDTGNDNINKKVSDSADKQDSSHFIVLQDADGGADTNAEDSSLPKADASTPTEIIKNESYSNILLSTNNNDMESLASSSNRTQLTNSIKLKFDGLTPPSSPTASPVVDNKKTSSEKEHPGLKSLFKKVLGYK